MRKVILILFAGHHFFVEMFREVAAVTKWLGGGFAAATEGDAISNLVGFSVCRDDGDASSYPNWSAALQLGVFDYPD